MPIAKLYSRWLNTLQGFFKGGFFFLDSCVVIVTAKLYTNLYIGIAVQFCKIVVIIFSKFLKVELIFGKK